MNVWNHCKIIQMDGFLFDFILVIKLQCSLYLSDLLEDLQSCSLEENAWEENEK